MMWVTDYIKKKYLFTNMFLCSSRLMPPIKSLCNLFCGKNVMKNMEFNSQK